jgi:predicted PurR-regulated permease PerM
MAKPRGPSSSPLFMLVATVTFIAALYFAKEILLPLGLAILLSFLLTPVANRLERWGLQRVPATLLVVVLLFAGLGALGYVVATQVIDLRYRLPNYQANVVDKFHAVVPLSQKMSAIFKKLNEFGSGPSEADKPASSGADEAAQSPARSGIASDQDTANGGKSEKPVEIQVVEKPSSPLAQARDWLGSLLAGGARSAGLAFGTAGMIVVLVFFILLDRENQRNRLLQLFGTSNLHATTEAMHDASHRVGRYLRMQFLVNACYGAAVGIGLSFIGVPGAVLWGVLGFSLRFIPYIGPWVAAALPILVSLGHSDGWMQPLLVVGWYIVLELIFNNAVEPWVYGSTTGVSVVGVMLSALFWTWLWGPIGLIIALPITVCLVVAARYVPQLRFLTVLLADQPPMTPSERVYQRLLAYDYHEPVRLARAHLKESSLTSFYDQVLIPALVLAEHDRHADLLNDEQEAFITEAAEDLVEELQEHSVAIDSKDEAETKAPAADTREPVSARVLCAPLRDQADEAAARMLAQLLMGEGFHVETGGADSLTSEIVERVAKHDIDVVVISILPPIMPRDSRLLWKRLRSQYPDLPIVVGFWSGKVTKENVAPPENDTLSKVVTTLADAVAQVRSIAAQQKPVAKTG